MDMAVYTQFWFWVVGGLTVIGGGVCSVFLILIWRQLKEIARTRQLTILPYLLSRLDSKEVFESRRHLFDVYCEHPEYFRSLNEIMRNNLREHCERIFFVYSEFGVFLRKNLIEYEFVEDTLHGNPARFWIILKHFAMGECQRRQEDHYIVPFQHVARLGFEYLKKYGHTQLVIFHPSKESLSKVITKEQITEEQSLVKKNLHPTTSNYNCSLTCCVQASAQPDCHSE